MGHTRAREYIAKLLRDNWRRNIQGREQAVPEPTIVTSGHQERIGENGLISISRGSTSITPQSFGWVEEHVEERATIDIRTDSGKDAMWGVLLSDGTSERYGGLVGETKRILDSVRTRDGDYDLIDGYEVVDIGSAAGAGRERAAVEVLLDQRATVVHWDPDSESDSLI